MLEVKNLSKTFDNSSVLTGINLTVNQGEIISLLGKSGSGKSTLLHLISGFEAPDTGSIHYKGELLVSKEFFCPPEKRHIGFVFQNYALFPHLTIEKNITFSITHKDKFYQKASVSKLLELVNMSGFEKQYPHQLSGGQQQRIAIARVLAHESDLILFDEAFSSIDTTLKLDLLTQIKEILKSYNKTAIFVTHDPKEAVLLSDRIAYIEEGKIIQYDTPLNLHLKPNATSIEALFGVDSFMFKKIQEIV